MAGAGQTLEVLFLLQLVVAPAAAVVGAFLGGPTPRSRLKWACFSLILPFVVLFLVYRRLAGQTAEGEPLRTPAATAAPVRRTRPVPRPVPPPSEADLRDVPEPVSACPDCGFLGIRMPGIQDGVWPEGGQIVFQVCPRCHYRGQPLTFSRREDYALFVDELASETTRADGAP